MKKKITALLLLFLIAVIVTTAFTLVGCSASNNQTGINPDTGQHVSGWYVDHRAAVSSADFSSCTACHGTSLKGGISGVSCFTTTVNGMSCHGHGGSVYDSADLHGADAKSAPDARTGKGFSSCQVCHGSNFSGGILASRTCLICHGVLAPHPALPWLGARTHITTNALNVSVCAICHTNGANLTSIPPPSPPTSGAPGCFNNTLCHGVKTGVCGTCHGIPPNGSTFPNAAGGHAAHTVLVNIGTDCNICHNGAGSGTALHQDGITEVAFTATYNANSGTATFSGVSCSNIICHGSSRTQTSAQANLNPPQSTPGSTPAWTNTIDVNTQCSLCHVLGPSISNPEITSYYSGQHRRHVYGASVACTSCHDPGTSSTKLGLVHFTSFTAPISAATASTTIRNTVNFNGTSCSPSCHDNQTW
jgi:predicted CxxxxCH...CXXCH cytochrome family protein